MIISNKKIKERLKTFVRNRTNQFKYRRFDMNNEMDTTKKRSFGKVVANLLQRFIEIFARFIFKTIIYGEKGPAMPPIKNLLLLEPATVLAMKIRTQKITSVEVVKTFIERIQEVNPVLNCVVDERFSDALKDAEEADNLIASGKFTQEELALQKPFLGVPMTTKDCIQVKGLLNTSGLHWRRDTRGAEDAPSIKQMREAGAIPFAVTNTSELCMWWESVNCVHGRTGNPYDANRIVGGSSGGEGATQGSACSPFGVGSDIGGSIRMPAYFNGIFGHKPSRFAVCNDGQFPSPYTDEQKFMLSTGPMCRYAVDLKPMLKVLAVKEKLPALRLDEPLDIKKLKIFYQENDLGGHLVSPVDKDIQEAFRKVVYHFKNTLKVEVNRVQIQRTKNTSAMWLANMKAIVSPGFDTQIAGPGNSINTWVEIGKWIFGRSHHTFIALMTALTEKFGTIPGTPKHQYLLSERDKIIEEFRELLKDDMSVFLYPTHPTVAPYHNEPIFKAFNFSYTALINLLGMPSCTIPLGLGSEGLPMGIQAVGNYDNDRVCLAVACELEKAFGGWRAPEVH